MSWVDFFWFARKCQICFRGVVLKLNVLFYKCEQELTSSEAIPELYLNLWTSFP